MERLIEVRLCQSLHLQAKGSERSFTTRRREPERKSLRKRRNVGTQDSSSDPCVLNLLIEQMRRFFTMYFLGDAKVIHRRLRGVESILSSPPVNNFGTPIRREATKRRWKTGELGCLRSLLVAQGFDWIEIGGLESGEKAEYHANEGADGKRDQH